MCRRPCNHCLGYSLLHLEQKRMTYSRAHLYGSNARMFGRAHLDKSNADLLEAMVFVGVAARQSCCCVEWRGAGQLFVRVAGSNRRPRGRVTLPSYTSSLLSFDSHMSKQKIFGVGQRYISIVGMTLQKSQSFGVRSDGRVAMTDLEQRNPQYGQHPFPSN